MMHTIYLTYHRAEKSFADILCKHLSSILTKFEIIDAQKVPVGELSHQWRRSHLEKSDILIFLASASFVNSDEFVLIEEFVRGGKLSIPIIASSYNYDLTYLKGIACLPAAEKTLRGIPSNRREAEYAAIARQIYDRAQTVLDEETQKQQQQILIHPDRTAEPADHALAATWTLRSNYRKRFFAKKKNYSPTEFLSALEAELQRIPILRITERERFEWWLLCIDYLDQKYPNENLVKRLNAETEEHFRDRQKYFTKENSSIELPLFFCPIDPLAEILRIWGKQNLAARWLYLGIGYLGLQVPFRRGFSQSFDLYKSIQDYLRFLTPAERQYVELSRSVRDAKCESLLAVFSRPWHGALDAEVDKAILLLTCLRAGDPAKNISKRDIRSAKSAALLNLLGARALWLGQVREAKQAYMRAMAQAKRENNPIAEWAAIEGLLIIHRWFKDNRSRSSAPTHEVDLIQKRDDLRRNASIRYVEMFIDSRTQSVQARQLTQMLAQLANDTEQLQSRPALNVSSEIDELEELVMDEEEMAFPLPMIGEAATLVGTLRLLSGLEPGDPRLVTAIRLLIRYGAGGMDDKFNFFSSSIHPSRSDFLEVWRAVLKPSRSISESLAKISFLDRYSEDVPIEAVDDVRFLCLNIIKQIQASTENGLIHYLRGRHFGRHAAWDIIKTLMEKCAIIASHCIERSIGALWILELLDNPDPAVWSKALTVLYISAWKEWWEIGAVQGELLAALADKIVERLQSRESRALYTAQNNTLLFVREHNIPQGIAKLLYACKQAQVSSRKITALNDILCRLLAALLRRDTAFYYLAFFSDDIFSWLISRKDKKTKDFLRIEIDRCLEFLARYQNNSTYFDAWASVAGQINSLSKKQSEQLVLIIQTNAKSLLDAAAMGRYMTPPLLALAAHLLRSKHQELHQWAQELITISPPTRHGLVCLAAAPLHKLGDKATVIERALFHCLRGLAEKPWPWFNNPEAQPPKREWRDASVDGVQDGLHAVHNALFFGHAPPSGFRMILVSAVAQIYNQITEVAEAAVNVLAIALQKFPDAVDMDQSVHALCWALARSDRDLRDAALRTATQHRARLCTCTSWSDLANALERFAPPKTLSSAWALRMGRLAATSAANTPFDGH